MFLFDSAWLLQCQLKHTFYILALQKLICINFKMLFNSSLVTSLKSYLISMLFMSMVAKNPKWSINIAIWSSKIWQSFPMADGPHINLNDNKNTAKNIRIKSWSSSYCCWYNLASWAIGLMSSWINLQVSTIQNPWNLKRFSHHCRKPSHLSKSTRERGKIECNWAFIVMGA